MYIIEASFTVNICFRCDERLFCTCDWVLIRKSRPVEFYHVSLSLVR